MKDQSLKELKDLDAGMFKDKRWKSEKIPILNEVLVTVPENKKLITEIKCGPEIIEILKEEINHSNLYTKQIEIIGFNLSTVAKAKQALPDHKVLWLAESDYKIIGKVFHPSVDKLIKKHQKIIWMGLDVWAGKMINQELVHKIKSVGLMLYVWTVNNSEKAKMLQSLGVDGITTDRAQWMKHKIKTINSDKYIYRIIIFG